MAYAVGQMLGDAPESADGTIAVIAHAMLNSLAVISGATATMLERELEPEQRRELLERAHGQAIHVTGVLQDLVRGLPEGMFDALERLNDELRR